MGSVIPVVGLALLDSLSLGTLVIPLALIVHWRAVRVPALTTYLFTVAAVYFLLGLGILLGFAGLGSIAERVTQTNVFPWIPLILGAALAIFGIFGTHAADRQELGKPRHPGFELVSPFRHRRHPLALALDGANERVGQQGVPVRSVVLHRASGEPGFLRHLPHAHGIEPPRRDDADRGVGNCRGRF